MALNLAGVEGLFKHSKEVLLKEEELKEIFVHSVNPGPNDWGGSNTWPMTILTALQDCYFILKIPDDFKSLEEIAIVVLPDATETIQWDIEFQASKAGESESNRGNNDLNVQKAVTMDIITELDLTETTGGNPTGLFPNPTYLKAGDYLAIWFQSDTDNIQVLGLRIKYKA